MSELQLMLGVEGLALLRGWLVGTREEYEQRLDEMESLLAERGQRPFVPGEEHDRAAGYAEWSKVYDDSTRNPIIGVEEPVVQRLLEEIEPGDAVEAACGTGRHLELLARRGHRVVGVDDSPEMLARAAQRVPAARLERGRLEALPLPDDCADLVVCTLALTHFGSLAEPVAELRRVARPGARVVISDVHPLPVMLGGHGSFRTERGLQFVRNHVHLAGDYLRAFETAGLRVRACLEPPYTDDAIVRSSMYQRIPDAVRAALVGLPAVIVWDLLA